LLIIFGHLIFFDLIFISFELLIKSIGVTLDAFLAEDTHDKNIVTAATNTLIPIADSDIEYINLKLFKNSPRIIFTTFRRIAIAIIPDSIPKGIPN